MNLILKLFANNEFRLVVQTPAYKRKNYGDDARTHTVQRKANLHERLRIVNKLLSSSDSYLIPVVDSLPNGKLVTNFLVRSDLLQQRAALLDITKKSQRRSLGHPRWGFRHPERNFTTNARHRILEAGAVTDLTCGKNAYEVTLTIPGSTPAALAAVADWTGWIVNRMLETIRKSAIGNEALWFYVWELQKRGALHMHWSIAHPDVKQAKRLAEALQYQWFELLLELQSVAGVDCFAKKRGGTHRHNPERWQSNVQKIRKSVAAYYSKYTSKNAQNQKRLSRWKAKDLHYPARWWGSGKTIKDLINKWRFKYTIEGLTLEQCEFVKEHFWELANSWEWVGKYEYKFCIEHHAIPMPLCSGKVQIAYGKPDTWPECWAAIKSLCESKALLGIDPTDKATVISRLADAAPKNKGFCVEEISWQGKPFFVSPFTGQVFETVRDVELEVATLQLQKEEQYMRTSGYAEQLDQLQKLTHQSGWSDSNNPYLIAEKKRETLIEYANSRMDYLLWLETPFEEKLAAFQKVSSTHPCKKPLVSNF